MSEMNITEGDVRRIQMIKTFVFMVALALLIGCAIPQKTDRYRKGCEYKCVKHYDSVGKFTGTTCWRECDD